MHRPVASHWQTLSHNVVSSAPHHEHFNSTVNQEKNFNLHIILHTNIATFLLLVLKKNWFYLKTYLISQLVGPLINPLLFMPGNSWNTAKFDVKHQSINQPLKIPKDHPWKSRFHLRKCFQNLYKFILIIFIYSIVGGLVTYITFVAFHTAVM
jgi:hypothetical protein